MSKLTKTKNVDETLPQKKTTGKRRINPNHKPGRKVKVLNKDGYIVSEVTDLGKLQKFRTNIPAGWCKKYWWDWEFPDFSYIFKSHKVDYAENHRKLVDSSNVSLSVTLSDESRLIWKQKENEKNVNTYPSVCISPKYQILKDVIHYSPNLHCRSVDLGTIQNQEFYDEVEKKNACYTLRESVLNSLSNNNKSLPSLLPCEKHRLLDVALFEEFFMQQKIRRKFRKKLLKQKKTDRGEITTFVETSEDTENRNINFFANVEIDDST